MFLLNFLIYIEAIKISQVKQNVDIGPLYFGHATVCTKVVILKTKG